MKWEVFYEKINEWAISTSASKISSLEEMGTSDEVTEAVNTLAFDDEKVATKLLNKAINLGVKFSGENLAELCGVCSEESFRKALYDSASFFTSKDLEDLYGCIDDDLILGIARKHKLKLPEDLAMEYEEEFCTDTSEAISWDYFYEHFFEWSRDFAVERLKAVTEYGEEDEVIEVLIELFDTLEIDASAFIQKALDAGVRFGIDNLIELNSYCDENTVNRAVLLVAKELTDENMEELYGEVDDALIEEICRLHHKALPEELREYDDFNYEQYNSEELIADTLDQAVFALDCLYELQNRLNTSSNISFIDMLSSSFFPSLLKYSSLRDAEGQMQVAIQAISDLNKNLKTLQKNSDIKMKGAKLSSVIDMWFDSGFFDAFVHLKISKLQKQTRVAIMQVQSIIKEIEAIK